MPLACDVDSFDPAFPRFYALQSTAPDLTALRRTPLRAPTLMQNPENLLVFSAGNDGEYTDREVCTSNSPGIAKNVLTVGATSSGETRLTATGADGKPIEDDNGFADINTMAVYSSYGPTEDGRIKPEIVAPGDEVMHAPGIHAPAGN